MTNQMKGRLLKKLDFIATLLLTKLTVLTKAWLERKRSQPSRLFHDYIEGMLSDYAEVKHEWQMSHASSAEILVRSAPWAIDIFWGVLQLLGDRILRAISLLFYATEQILLLSSSGSPFRLLYLSLKAVFGLLHRMTGNVGKRHAWASLRLHPDGRIAAWSKESEHIFGIRAEDAIGQCAVGTFIPQLETSGEAMGPLIDSICAAPKQHLLNINENIDAQGNTFHVFWINWPLYGKAGALAGVLCLGFKIEDPEMLSALTELRKHWKSVLQRLIPSPSSFEGS